MAAHIQLRPFYYPRYYLQVGKLKYCLILNCRYCIFRHSFLVYHTQDTHKHTYIFITRLGYTDIQHKVYIYILTKNTYICTTLEHTHARTQINAHTYSHHKILSAKSIYQLGSLKEKKKKTLIFK